ncbi:hypothetical protein [Planctomicrobium sp. SH664]|uniref:hypothetical protein n=1 Tax=Planctomicrobium sp. SH664 TaxID=3448125 RepID=UPI003F5C2EA5
MSNSATDTWTAEDGHTAIYDPVPADAESGWYGSSHQAAHALEMDIQRALLALPDFQFSSLRVHRLPDGICLTGVVKVPPGPKPRFDRLVARATGIDRVLNHLVLQPTEQNTPK